jgi:uncharacterized protein YcfJ
MITQRVSQMSKSTWIGIVAGIGVAVAGAAAAYTYLGGPAVQEPSAARAGAKEECWDEEVATVADPKDPHRIAGTAVGAVVGGAVGKDVGDRDITTVVGAAAGALIGREIQEKIQDNRADQRTVATTERRCAPIGSR